MHGSDQPWEDGREEGSCKGEAITPETASGTESYSLQHLKVYNPSRATKVLIGTYIYSNSIDTIPHGTFREV